MYLRRLRKRSIARSAASTHSANCWTKNRRTIGIGTVKRRRLRQTVFRLAASRHPLVQRPDQLFESSEVEVKQEIAKQLGKSWLQIEHELFTDVIEFHRLSAFEGYDSADALLSRYNVAQCQAVLFDAIDVTIWAGDDFKSILRYAKLARLMHTIRRQSDGSYVFRLDGPASVLRQSRRYGVALAKFLPSLLACSNWRLQARIQHRRSKWENLFRLSPEDGLRSHLAEPEPFDSGWEQKFADRWGDEAREGWTLIREGEILYQDQKVFVPDFVFQHASGVRVAMEIVGFWTPEYLAEKLKTLQTFRESSILLAVSDSIDWPELDWGTAEAGVSPRHLEPIRFKSTIRTSEVLSRLEAWLQR